MTNICMNCNNKFYIRRSILDLFNTKKEYLCMKCYKENPLNIKFEEIILDKYQLLIVSMFNNNFKIKDYNLYFNEYNKIFESLIQKENYHLLFYDDIIINDDTIMEFDAISKAVESNIILLTFTKK